MKTIKSLVLVFGMAFLYSSCAKDGATGPAGPTGPTGGGGATGAAGATGPMGNANVKDTVITLTAASWTASANYDFDVVSVPQITAPFLATGEIFVFFSSNSGVQWDPLIYTTLNPGGYTLDYYVNPGNLGLYFGPAANPNTFFSAATLQFRLVFVTNQGIKQHPNTNWRNYSEVKAIIDQQNSLKN
jgi:hypothetical protein